MIYWWKLQLCYLQVRWAAATSIAVGVPAEFRKILFYGAQVLYRPRLHQELERRLVASTASWGWKAEHTKFLV